MPLTLLSGTIVTKNTLPHPTMPRKKNKQQTFAIPSAQELYDLWMSQIEPELTTENIQHVDEMHAGETPEERTERYARYTEAFKAFDAHRKSVDLALMKEVARLDRKTRKAAEKKQHAEDQAVLEHIDQSIHTMP